MAERKIPDVQANEREMLRGWLEFHRATFAGKLDGLTPEQLDQRTAEPSPMSLLGMLRHHAEGERYLFEAIFDGQPDVPIWETEDFLPLDRVDDDVVVEAWARWHHACERSRALEAAADLDQLSTVPGDWTGEPVSMRWLMMHAIEEYARHNGHADLLRERLDGETGW